MTRNALIVGGGIGGLATAIALGDIGIEVEVHEAYRDPTGDIAGFINIASNGMYALDRIGCLEPALDSGFLAPTINLWSGSGKLLGAMPFAGAQYGGPAGLTLARGDMVRVLVEQAQSRGIKVITGSTLVDATPTAGGVTARFADEDTRSADVLIGADGIHSRVRTIIDPSAAPAHYTGLFGFGGYTSADLDITPSVFNLVFGKRAFFGYVRDPNGPTRWFANIPHADEPDRDELAAVPSSEWKRRLVALFADDNTPAATTIEATDHKLRPSISRILDTAPRWSRDRMIIIGDAAHCASPSSGQGASMAVEDAVVLARSLHENPDPAAAFAHYEGLRRERVERIIKHGARGNRSKTQGPLARKLTELLMPPLLKRMAKKDTMAWQYTYHA